MSESIKAIDMTDEALVAVAKGLSDFIGVQSFSFTMLSAESLSDILGEMAERLESVLVESLSERANEHVYYPTATWNDLSIIASLKSTFVDHLKDLYHHNLIEKGMEKGLDEMSAQEKHLLYGFGFIRQPDKVGYDCWTWTSLGLDFLRVLARQEKVNETDGETS